MTVEFSFSEVVVVPLSLVPSDERLGKLCYIFVYLLKRCAMQFA